MATYNNSQFVFVSSHLTAESKISFFFDHSVLKSEEWRVKIVIVWLWAWVWSLETCKLKSVDLGLVLSSSTLQRSDNTINVHQNMSFIGSTILRAATNDIVVMGCAEFGGTLLCRIWPIKRVPTRRTTVEHWSIEAVQTGEKIKIWFGWFCNGVVILN